jgi:hypothetical protein
LCADGGLLLTIKLKAYLQAADPEGFEDLPRSMFDESETEMSQDLENRSKQIENIYSEAERCQKYHKDENAWNEVVRLVLRAAGVDAPTDMLEINNV